ncbi:MULTISPECIES: UvrD-helicase domain-containing protein [Streptomyces]|uniref:UvrD-helicase domain-containing protein n=1 Tax=Streptomyces TaxID=1883 RepID=UPI00055E04E9|nr:MULTISPECIES: UvrD-helicase domain-containing protein [Streptomyces]MBZ6114591.1 AAA family ATPase [Streptomyces olivaceus]MBZ6128420.1 AAA family ATPase [Streptomyces olivaceus]MBZ6149296.1 AAA family ATPase [Streptomyces olivaceus]MBZ6163184.1 AAA family ATPase [Streptomyces olivaceus]MBZ6190988.1 AAA family ATPase [Streptomyces olivaceus]
MPQLAFANSFWESYDALEKPVRNGVRKAMQKFQQLTVPELQQDKGLHLESVEKAADRRMRTIRINDFWRGVVLAPDDGSDVFLLVNVVAHDDAYTWAAKRLYTTNSATRALEVRNVRAIEQLTPQLEKAAAAAESLLFAKYSDTVLRELGIDDQVLRAVRTIIDKAQLEAFGTLLPEDQFEVLQYLAEGFPPEEVYRDVVAVRRPVDAGPDPDETLAAAIVNTTSRITLVSGPDELADILEKPFAAWRVFLHPSQRRVAYRVSYGGPVQVTGGPGTGKTVAALHRVKHLLTRSPDTRVLLTTYTNALAASLRENLALLLDGDESLLGRAEVTTVNAYAHGVVARHDGKVPSPIGDREERQVWQRVVKKLGLPWTEQFLAQEYRHVVLAQDLRTLDAYRAASRRGRGSALSPIRREQLWPAVEMFESMLRDQRATTHLKVCARAAELLAASAPTHDHVVVDEAQDLHPAQWRVLRGAVAPGSDDLFLTGDPHQRIYDSRVSLGSLGIAVAGRTHRLRINYRSTEEILAWSTGILSPVSVDDLGGEGSDTLAGYRSLLHGRRPQVGAHGSEHAEIAALVEQVRKWIAQGIKPSEIGVCARFNVLLDKAYDKLTAAGVPVVRVKDQPAPGVDGVRLATMHAMKGLEFRCVAVLGVTAGAVPFAREVTPAAVDALQHYSDLLRERCLLFVACTRAREALAVSWSGAGSPFVPDGGS